MSGAGAAMRIRDFLMVGGSLAAFLVARDAAFGQTALPEVVVKQAKPSAKPAPKPLARPAAVRPVAAHHPAVVSQPVHVAHRTPSTQPTPPSAEALAAQAAQEF